MKASELGRFLLEQAENGHDYDVRIEACQCYDPPTLGIREPTHMKIVNEFRLVHPDYDSEGQPEKDIWLL